MVKFNIGSSFSYKAGIGGSRRCTLFTSSICQCCILQVFKAAAIIATRMRGKSKQMLKSPRISLWTSYSETHALTNWTTPVPDYFANLYYLKGLLSFIILKVLVFTILNWHLSCANCYAHLSCYLVTLDNPARVHFF